jgi:hypothetical protein
MSFEILLRVALVRTDVSEKHHRNLQGNETLESSEFVARICLTTDGEESLLHGTSTVEFIRHHGVIVDGLLLRRMCLDQPPHRRIPCRP